jgi:hypothetical protein
VGSPFFDEPPRRFCSSVDDSTAASSFSVRHMNRYPMSKAEIDPELGFESLVGSRASWITTHMSVSVAFIIAPTVVRSS